MAHLARSLLLGLATLGLCAACGSVDVALPGSSGTASGSATPAPTLTPLPRASLDPGLGLTGAAAEPADLPDMPGARRTSLEREVDDGLAILEIEYTVDADIEAVRRHYRRVMQEHGWRVGEADVDDDGWELQASKGSREVEVEIEPHGGTSHVEVSLSDVVAPLSSDPGP